MTDQHTIQVTINGKLYTRQVESRLLLSDFTGVDLTQISEVALLFGQTPTGTLFMGDMEMVKP